LADPKSLDLPNRDSERIPRGKLWGASIRDRFELSAQNEKKAESVFKSLEGMS
jgi:hypothetical protein